jgi:hypothetical protein
VARDAGEFADREVQGMCDRNGNRQHRLLFGSSRRRRRKSTRLATAARCPDIHRVSLVWPVNPGGQSTTDQPLSGCTIETVSGLSAASAGIHRRHRPKVEALRRVHAARVDIVMT